jgi:hypothetical protein
MTRGLSATLPTQLPAQYERLFAWNLDRRCKAVRDVAADLYELWQDLGGVENLSAQKRWLCERVVYLRRRCVAYETAVLHNSELAPGETELPLPMEAGTYSNHANVLQGYLRTLGLNRQAKPTESLHDLMYRDDPHPPAEAPPGDDQPTADATASPEEIAAQAPSAEVAP